MENESSSYQIPSRGVLIRKLLLPSIGLWIVFLVFSRGDSAYSLLGVFPALLVCGVGLHLLQQQNYKRHSYSWYCRAYPTNMNAEAGVSCRHCGGRQVVVRSLPKISQIRAHVCQQCGETLYYSSEK
jgi:hypothetical protein